MADQHKYPTAEAVRLMWQLKSKHLREEKTREALGHLLAEFGALCKTLELRVVRADREYVEVISGERGAIVRIDDYVPELALAGYTGGGEFKVTDKNAPSKVELDYDPVTDRMVSPTNSADVTPGPGEPTKQPRDGLSELADNVGLVLMRTQWRGRVVQSSTA